MTQLSRGGLAYLAPRALTNTWTTVPGGVMYARTNALGAAPDAPVIVLVHGMVISSSYMIPTAERLAPLSRVYAVDLPGYGKSYKPWPILRLPQLAEALAAYLERANSFDEIFLMLFSHGVDSVGLAPIPHWRQLLGRARKHGTFVGVDERVYPRDFAVFVRYYFDLLQKIPSRYPLPPPLTLTQLAEFLAQHKGCYQVQWQADSIG